MNRLIENNLMEEIKYDSDFAYVLKEKSLFALTEYKFLQSQNDNLFIKCIKMLYDGKQELYYHVDRLKALADIITITDFKNLESILKNLFLGIYMINNYGFLSRLNTDISLNHIYINPIGMKINFVYVPLNYHLYNDNNSFEKVLKQSLINGVEKNSIISDSDKSIVVEKIKKIVLTNNNSVKNSAVCQHRSLRLIPFDQHENVIVVNKPMFTIGQLDTNDYVSKNTAVSRQHCKIIWDGKRYAVYEWYGYRSNKTYVNGKVIEKEGHVYLSNGDILQIANSKFKVVL